MSRNPISLAVRTVVETLESRRLLAYVNSATFSSAGTDQHLNVTYAYPIASYVPVINVDVRSLTLDTAVPVQRTATSAGNTVATYKPLAPGPLASGWNEVRIVDGTSEAEDFVGTFSFLDGDFDANGVVDFNDYLTLANNYNQTNKTFADGDINYSGTIDFNDVMDFQNAYGHTLPALPSQAGGVAVADVVSGALDVGWTANADPRDGFKIYRSDDDGLTYTLVHTEADPDARAWRDEGTTADPLVVGTKYWYRVRAYTNANGVSAATSKAWGIPTVPVAAPTNVMAYGTGPGQIAVSWTPSTDASVTNYRVYRSTASGVAPVTANLVATTGAATSAITDPGLSAGATYYYTVVAVGDGNSVSVPTLEVSGVADTDPSNRFQAGFKFGADNAAVMPGYVEDIGNGYRDGSSGYSYGWVDAATGLPAKAGPTHDADPANPSLTDSSVGTVGANGAVSWEVAVPNGTYFVKLVAGDPAVTSGTYAYGVENDTTFLNGTAASGAQWVTATGTVTVYDGRLTVKNIGGADDHALAYVEITDAAGRARNAVDAPSDVVATAASSTKIDVRWTDESDNETGFRVDRAPSANGPWTQVGTVPANAAVFTDTVAPSGTYYYRVGATKGALVALQTSDAVTTPAGNGQWAYNAARTAWPAGAAVQAEDFDAGGNTVSYDDVNGNAGGYYRNGNVDVGYNIPNKRYFVGWTRKTEWIEYTVHVPTAGKYRLVANVACDGLGGTFEVYAGGVDQYTSFTVPDTGGFTTYKEAPSGTFNLAAGDTVIRLDAVDYGVSAAYLGDMDWLKLVPVGASTPIPSVGLYGTGLNNSGSLLPYGASDPHYQQTHSPWTANAMAMPAVDVWAPRTSSSQWIGISQQPNVAEGDYDYQTSFDLGSIDPSTVHIDGRWVTDNAGLGIVVNGHSFGYVTPPEEYRWHSFTIPSDALQAGPNTIVFKTHNIYGWEGIQVQMGLAAGNASGGPWTGTNSPPTLSTPTAAPATVTGTSTVLSVLGSDDGGEANLTYMWSLDGNEPAPVTYSQNGNNAAKTTTVTFTQAGTYTFYVTTTDGDGLTDFKNIEIVVSFGTSGSLLTIGHLTNMVGEDAHVVYTESGDSFAVPNAVLAAGILTDLKIASLIDDPSSVPSLGTDCSSLSVQNSESLTINTPGLYALEADYTPAGSTLVNRVFYVIGVDVNFGGTETITITDVERKPKPFAQLALIAPQTYTTTIYPDGSSKQTLDYYLASARAWYGFTGAAVYDMFNVDQAAGVIEAFALQNIQNKFSIVVVDHGAPGFIGMGNGSVGFDTQGAYLSRTDVSTFLDRDIYLYTLSAFQTQIFSVTYVECDVVRGVSNNLWLSELADESNVVQRAYDGYTAFHYVTNPSDIDFSIQKGSHLWNFIPYGPAIPL